MYLLLILNFKFVKYYQYFLLYALYSFRGIPDEREWYTCNVCEQVFLCELGIFELGIGVPTTGTGY